MVSTVALNPVMDWAQEDHSLVGLVSAVARGDQRALAQLYDRTSRVVYGLALRVLDDPSAAEDIALEVYIQVWRTAESYDGGRGTVSAWLVTLARSRAIDWLRARRSRGREQKVHWMKFLACVTRGPIRRPLQWKPGEPA
jgi:RNA polymerase sigma-70 factor (ECF subfamily)